MALRLRRGDTVQVVTGAEKGKRGKVLRVLRVNKELRGRTLRGKNLFKKVRRGDLVVVQGVNLRYRHIRRSQKHPQGGRIQLEMPIHISNVMLYDAGKDRPVRTRVENDKDGNRVRVSTVSGKPV